MNSMVRERGSHTPVLYIAVTPEIRRALALLAEASISLLDEVDAPAAELEDDREFDDADYEDDNPAEEDDAPEEDDPGEANGDDEICASDTDREVILPETSAGLADIFTDHEDELQTRIQFDPRLGRRTPRGEYLRGNFRYGAPTFPHERENHPAFEPTREMFELKGRLRAIALRRRQRQSSWIQRKGDA